MATTNQDLWAEIEQARQRINSNSRELVIANDGDSREVYKQLKIKTNNDISRSSEDIGSLTSSSLGEHPFDNQVGEDIVTPPATTSSRVSGISVQHVRTPRGIKLNLAVQTEADAESGTFVELTAELKRHSRLRELKRYDGDDYYFEQLYVTTIEELKQLEPAQGARVAMGRMHIRGARANWFANMMAVAELDDQGLITRTVIHINGDEFEIELTGDLSPRQQAIYHSTGIWGQLRSQRPTPRLETAPRKAFK